MVAAQIQLRGYCIHVEQDNQLKNGSALTKACSLAKCILVLGRTSVLERERRLPQPHAHFAHKSIHSGAGGESK